MENDGDATIWNTMAVRCWPTFVIVSPRGVPLLYLVGETHKEMLFKFVDVALKYYREKGIFFCKKKKYIFFMFGLVWSIFFVIIIWLIFRIVDRSIFEAG